MRYFLGIIFAFFDPVIYGGSIIIDNVLSNHSFKSIYSFIIYIALMDLIIFSPIFYFLFTPSLPSVEILPLFLLLAAANLLYKFPFFTALKLADTSIVTALFSLGRIFVPILAFILVGETLGPFQYVGFGLVIFSTLILTKTKGVFKINKVFWYMLAVSFFISIEGVFYKMIFERTDWSTGVFWSGIISVVLALCLFVLPQARKVVKKDYAIVKKRSPLLIGQGVIDFVAEIGFTLSVSMIPVTVVKGIAGTQPFFVLIYSFFLRKTRFKHLVNEDMAKGSLLRKCLAFALMILGTILIVVRL